MEDMATFTPYYEAVSDSDNGWTHWGLTEWTIVTWYLTCRAATFIGHTTYTADITFAVSLVVICVSGVPSPLCNGVP